MKRNEFLVSWQKPETMLLRTKLLGLFGLDNSTHTSVVEGDPTKLICDAEDIAKIVKELSKGFSEAQMIALEEIIQKVVRRMDAQGFFNHDHEQGEMVNYAERENEDAGLEP